VRKEEHLRIFLHGLSFEAKILSKKKLQQKNPDRTVRILENNLFFETEVV